MTERVADRVRRGNFRAALAQFVREHLPVDDPHSDEMIDEAWRIADRLEGRFEDAFEDVQRRRTTA